MMDFKKELRLAFSENKLAVCTSTVIFVVCLLAGYYFASDLNTYLAPAVDQLTNKAQSGEIELTFQSIFSNNIRIVFSMFLAGILLCFSALILAFNGLFLGFFIAIQEDLTLTLLYIVPHAIFELPSCIIACAAGFVLFSFTIKFFKTLSEHKDDSIFRRLYAAYTVNFEKLKQAFILLIVASVLMVIAGIIEVYFTGFIASLISNFI